MRAWAAILWLALFFFFSCRSLSLLPLVLRLIAFARCYIVLMSSILLFANAESDIYEDPSVRFESKKILQPDPTNMDNYLVSISISF